MWNAKGVSFQKRCLLADENELENEPTPWDQIQKLTLHFLRPNSCLYKKNGDFSSFQIARETKNAAVTKLSLC